MVVTELYSYLRKTEPNLRDIIIFHTSDRNVVSGSKVAVAALLDHYEDARVQLVDIEVDDFNDQNDIESFLDKVVKTMAKERDEFKVTDFILNVSGGRKIQTIVLSLYAGILGISEVYNVIDHNFQSFNEYLELIRTDVDKFANLTSLDEIKEEYAKKSDDYDSLFYPDFNAVTFIRVPVIQMPVDEKHILKKIIRGVPLEDEDVNEVKLKAYQKSGLITYDRSRTYGTDLGKILLSYI
jgi:CRISPR-associated protein Csx14